MSTITFVDLTDAAARTPGSRPRSSAASALMSDMTRCGPAWISTRAITLSFSTRVTMPGKRLRADTFKCGSSGDASRISSATCRPSIVVGPRSDPGVSRPASIQRRTVSSLTPSSSATSLIRRCVIVDQHSPYLRIKERR